MKEELIMWVAIALLMFRKLKDQEKIVKTSNA